MKYKDQFYVAAVEGNELIYNGEKLSPSEFARRVTNTSRNAWRDIWVKRPGDSQWVFAEHLRSSSNTAHLADIEELKMDVADLHIKSDITWTDDVYSALENLGGKSALNKIYGEAEKVRKSAGRTWPPSADAIVRRELENHSSDSDAFLGRDDLFYMPDGKGAGIWAIRKK
jgi:hypothetical protein